MGSIADTFYHFIKLSAVVFVAGVFLIAITNILHLIEIVLFGGIVSEFFDMISMFLPFNASAVFGSVGVIFSGILSFMLARKIFDLTSWSISAS